MKTDLPEIQQSLVSAFKKHMPLLKVTAENDAKTEFAGTVEAMQGKKKVDGIYFGSVIPKPKDIRLYFFPLYTHADAFVDIPAPLRKCLKGKTCFHIKKMDEELEKSINEMIETGVKTYKEAGLL